MKKRIKILLYTSGALVLLYTAAAVALPPLIKRYIEKNSLALIGREVSIESLSVNPLNGGVGIGGFRMMEADNSSSFVTIDRFRIRIRLLPLLWNNFTCREVWLYGADIKIYQDRESFNFDDIIELLTVPGDSPSVFETWAFGINDIKVEKSSIYYRDLSINGEWSINDISLHIPGVYFADKDTDVGVNLKFRNGGTLRTNMRYDLAKSMYDMNIVLEGLPLNDMLPYVRQYMGVRSLGGKMSADLNVVGSSEHLMRFSVRGSVDISDVAVTDVQKNSILKIASASVAIDDFNPNTRNLILSKLSVCDMEAMFEWTAEGENTFSKLLTVSEAMDSLTGVSTAEAGLSSVFIKEMEITGSSIAYADMTLGSKFRYNIHDISVHSYGLSSGRTSTINGNALLQKSGKASFTWTGVLNDPANQKIRLSLENLDLRDFSPQSEYYYGYPLKKGIANATVEGEVLNGGFNGIARVDAYRAEAGSRIRKSQPIYRIPLRMGLYMLNDRDDRITLEIPVYGDIASPDYSARAIVARAISTSLLKVVTSPALLLKGRQSEREEVREIVFDPLALEFTAEQYGRMADLAELITEKPDLKITLIQKIDYNSALEAYAMKHLSTIYEKGRVDDGTKKSSLAAFVDDMLRSRGVKPRGSLASKAVELFGAEAETSLLEGVLARNALLSAHMYSVLDVPKRKLELKAESLDVLRSSRGKNMFEVIVEYKGETTDDLPDDKTPE